MTCLSLLFLGLVLHTRCLVYIVGAEHFIKVVLLVCLEDQISRPHAADVSRVIIYPRSCLLLLFLTRGEDFEGLIIKDADERGIILQFCVLRRERLRLFWLAETSG